MKVRFLLASFYVLLLVVLTGAFVDWYRESGVDRLKGPPVSGDSIASQESNDLVVPAAVPDRSN